MIRFIGLMLMITSLGIPQVNADNDYAIEIVTRADIYPADRFSIYQNSQYPHFTVTEISHILDIEKAMSKGLPHDEGEAIGIAKQQINQYQQVITQAWQNNTVIHRYRLTQLPAIVFNHGDAVWYGERLDLAIDAYTALLESR